MKNIVSSICTMKTTTKMYLSVILSTVCIMFYQYQLSKASFLTLQRGDVFGGNNNIVTSESRNINDIKLKEVHIL